MIVRAINLIHFKHPSEDGSPFYEYSPDAFTTINNIFDELQSKKSEDYRLFKVNYLLIGQDIFDSILSLAFQ
jgi:hypothetical protein